MLDYHSKHVRVYLGFFKTWLQSRFNLQTSQYQEVTSMWIHTVYRQREKPQRGKQGGATSKQQANIIPLRSLFI